MVIASSDGWQQTSHMSLQAQRQPSLSNMAGLLAGSLVPIEALNGGESRAWTWFLNYWLVHAFESFAGFV